MLPLKGKKSVLKMKMVGKEAFGGNPSLRLCYFCFSEKFSQND